MKEDIKATVLMSVYNTPKEQLKESIESILKQTYQEFEFLIINDGADKECTELIESYKDERIEVIQNEENIGLAKSLNKGLEIANGKYIIRMDADDISHPTRIEKQIKYADEHPEYSIIATRANIIDENGLQGSTNKYGEILKKDLIKNTPFIHPSMLIKKDDLIKERRIPFI